MTDDITAHRARRGLPILVPRRIEKEITFCGHRAKVACDGMCHKAWGLNSRPRISLSDNVDDVVWLSDSELGDAPTDPGTSEGDHSKPDSVRGAQDVNKWCVRECERMSMSAPDEWRNPLQIRDWSRRRYNIPSSDPDRRSL